jgi:hypothetical protein
MTQVKKLFDYMRINAYNLRFTVTNADGQAFWNTFKNILGQYDDLHFTWKTVDNDEMLKLIEYTVDGYGKKKIVEVAHFQIQCVRIPHTEAPCLRKLVQIALNLGLYDAKMEKYQHSASTIEDFISDEDLVALSAKLPDNLFTEVQALMVLEFKKVGIDGYSTL